jgi:hypothetical protein
VQVEVNWEASLVEVVVLGKGGHLKDLVQFLRLVVAPVVDQIIVLICEHWLQHSRQQVVRQRDGPLNERVSQNRVPNGEVVRVDVLHEPRLIVALVVVVVVALVLAQGLVVLRLLVQSYEVSRIEGHGHRGLIGVPLATVLGDFDVAVILVLFF